MKLRGRLLTIKELAKEHGVSKQAMHQRLRKLNELYGGKLFVRATNKPNSKILVREDVLKLAMMGLQEDTAPVTQTKFDELYEYTRQLKKQMNGLGARLRTLEARKPCSCEYGQENG